MRKTTAKKLKLNKITVANLDNSRDVNAKAPTNIGCTAFGKCPPPISNNTCF
ncbi:MAG: hypothetical protein JO154_26255 [Chitinophaga sp.]|uniref:hypothetical protein n=1 Tax=Chitinophaga sp. TaxID=1869181 RepID=UPI0025C5506D|nr:hypothetical protein [Chitinophaga sp.]MBV8256125.1 hypothetical protein [Chitinophaga sp.]